jgi:hypothetical protein
MMRVSIERLPLWNNRQWDAGPFDIIGDVHGCFDELAGLLSKLGLDALYLRYLRLPELIQRLSLDRRLESRIMSQIWC